MEKKKREKPRVDIVVLRKAVAGVMGEGVSSKIEPEESYGASRMNQPVETFGEGRKCKCCSCALAQSNPDNLCMPCDSAIAEWKIFSWNRAEIEQ